MKKYWIISIFLTIILWGTGVYAFIFISDYIPDQLRTPSSILAVEDGDTVQEVDQPRTITEVIRESQKLVVKLETPIGYQGSGFLYNDIGDIITNAHVVTGTEEVTIITADSRQLPGTVIGISETIDVAVVRVPELADTTPLALQYDLVEIGEEVLALGSPFGLENTVTTGIISGVNRSFELAPYYYENVYQISAPIAQGNSGGPLIHSKTGEVLGINSAASDQGAIGFSIPIGNVIDMIEGWSESPMTTLPNLDAFADHHHSDSGFGEFTDEDMALYIVNYFYESINYRDYITAYSLLGSARQTNTSYQDFRNSFLNIHWINLDGTEVSTLENGRIEVTVLLTEEIREEGETSSKQYKITYIMGYENDQMKILSEE